MSTLPTYTDPTALVSTVWTSERLDDTYVRLLEDDVDTTAYGRGHNLRRGAPRGLDSVERPSSAIPG